MVGRIKKFNLKETSKSQKFKLLESLDDEKSDSKKNLSKEKDKEKHFNLCSDYREFKNKKKAVNESKLKQK